MPRVTGWNDGLCQDYDRRLGKWFADRLGARYQLRKEFDMIEQAKQQAALLRYAMTNVLMCEAAADTIDALAAEVEDVTSMYNRCVDDVHALRAEVERLSQHIHTCGPNCTKAGCMNKRLMAEVESLRKDAERYRFLRQRTHGDKLGVEVRIGGFQGFYWLGKDGHKVEEQLDAAIDTAMQGVQS